MPLLLPVVWHNSPSLPRRHSRVSFSQGGQQEVEYQLKGARGALAVSADGTVTLRGALDRESSDGGVVVAEVLAVDGGAPPLTATATLTVVISDINDCPPTLASPSVLHVQEHARTPALLATLTADDEDVWALGHGPPFNLTLAPSNTAHVLDKVSLKFNPCEFVDPVCLSCSSCCPLSPSA